LKPVYLILLSLALSLGLAGCIQRELSALEIVRKPTIVSASETAVTQASPTPTAAPALIQDSPSTPAPSPTIQPTTPLCNSKNGQIAIKQLASDWLPDPLDYRVYTPPCYDQLPEQRYPVLYLIHGYGSNDAQWEQLGVIETADHLISAGAISPFILVMPHDRNYDIQPPKNKFKESVLFELVPAVDSEYRTIPSSKYRAIGGLSRGGNWALHIGLTCWDVFGLIGGHSAPLFTKDASFYLRDWLNQIPSDSYPRIYLDAGERDQWLQEIIHFEEILDEYGIPHELYIFPGGHTEEYWSAHVAQYLRWYARDW
jgi:enterochelin esterase-like enzyme